jgi:hypothetical protein
MATILRQVLLPQQERHGLGQSYADRLAPLLQILCSCACGGSIHNHRHGMQMRAGATEAGQCRPVAQLLGGGEHAPARCSFRWSPRGSSMTSCRALPRRPEPKATVKKLLAENNASLVTKCICKNIRWPLCKSNISSYNLPFPSGPPLTLIPSLCPAAQFFYTQ